MKPFFSFTKLVSFAKEFKFTIADQTLYLFDSKGLVGIRTPDVALVERLKSADCKAEPRDGLCTVFSKYLDGARLFAFRDTGIVLPQDENAYRVYVPDDSTECVPTCKLIDRRITDIFSPAIINGAWEHRQPLVLTGDEQGENVAILPPFVVINPSENFREAIRNMRYISDIFSSWIDYR